MEGYRKQYDWNLARIWCLFHVCDRETTKQARTADSESCFPLKGFQSSRPLFTSVCRSKFSVFLTAEDRKTLGGIEYRALKVLLRIVIGKNPKTTVVKQQVVVDSGDRVSRWASSTWYNLPGPLDPPCGPQVQELSWGMWTRKCLVVRFILEYRWYVFVTGMLTTTRLFVRLKQWLTTSVLLLLQTR